MAPINSTDISIDFGLGGAADSSQRQLQQAPAKSSASAKQRVWSWVRKSRATMCAYLVRGFTERALRRAWPQVKQHRLLTSVFVFLTLAAVTAVILIPICATHTCPGLPIRGSSTSTVRKPRRRIYRS